MGHGSADLVAEAGAGRHVVQFYAAEPELSGQVCEFLATGLSAGAPALVVAAPERRAAFAAGVAARLGADGPVPGDDLLVEFDAAELADLLLTDGHADPEKFETRIGDVIRELAATGQPVRVYGEIVAVLWDTGLVTAALELEELWNGLGQREAFSLWCGYPADQVASGCDPVSAERVAGLHSAVIRPPATWTATAAFGLEADAPRQARHFARDQVARTGDLALTSDAELVTGELVANAARHAGTRFEVTVAGHPSGIRISVRDQAPLPAAERPRARSGHGLDVIAGLAGDWGVAPVPGGKLVWAQLRAPR